EVVDPEVAEALNDEVRRQATGRELIASENFVSEAVLEAMGSVFTNKYAEGYPGKRYYGGCENVDRVERIAIDRAKQLFGAEHANVQAHSGTQANISVYMTALEPGATVLGMNLAHGGHLTHGHPLNFSGKTYKFVAYGVTKDTETIDYDEIERLGAAGIHPSPVPPADFVSPTTHKTLRGPRGGLVLCPEKYAKDLDRITFPAVEGGPLEHVIAAKAEC